MESFVFILIQLHSRCTLYFWYICVYGGRGIELYIYIYIYWILGMNSSYSSVFGIFVCYDDHFVWREYLTCNYRVFRSYKAEYQTILLVTIVGLAPFHLSLQVLTKIWGRVFHLVVLVETLRGWMQRKLIPIDRGENHTIIKYHFGFQSTTKIARIRER